MDYSSCMPHDSSHHRGEGSGAHDGAECAEADSDRIKEVLTTRAGDDDMTNPSPKQRKNDPTSLDDALAFTIDRTARAESPTRPRRENSLGRKTAIAATVIEKHLASVSKRGKKNIFAPQNLFPKAFPLRRKVSSPPKRNPAHLSTPSPTSYDSDAGVSNVEDHFAFYAAYDNSYTNVFIHMLFVIPVLFTALVFCTYTPAFVPTPASFPGHQYVVFNFSFFIAAFYSFYFLSLDRRSGWLAALLVLLCWPAANAMVTHVDKEIAWKVHIHLTLTCNWCLSTLIMRTFI